MGSCCVKTEKSEPLLNNNVSRVEQTALLNQDGIYQPPKMVSTVESQNETVNIKKFPFSKKVGIHDFETIKCIGKGSFAKVMMVKKKDTGKTYAMKCLTKKDLVRRKQIKHTMTEREVIANIKHPFIVTCHFAFQTDTKLYLVTDFFNGGELFYHLKNDSAFSCARARFYAAEIVLALECLHNHGIIYRDMKPENLLLDADGHIRLTDFGLSKDSLHNGGLTKTFCGTPEYLAPEVIKQSEQGYGKAVDWWALGVLIFEMRYGVPPFYHENLKTMYEDILHKDIPFPKSFSPQEREIISGLMEREPRDRLGYNGAEEVKASTFFISIDFERLYRKEVQVPFKPNILAEDDIQNVDEDFLVESINDAPMENSHSLIDARGKFPGFTYNEKTLDEY